MLLKDNRRQPKRGIRETRAEQPPFPTVDSQYHPDWPFTDPPYPAFLYNIESMATLEGRHPRTTRMGALAFCSNMNLEWVGALLDHSPNNREDISACFGMLGGQTYTARHQG